MQHCKQCNRPLTEFEVLFHQKARSKPEIACKCWSCSGAKETFDKVIDTSYRIKACLIGLLFALVGILIGVVGTYSSAAFGITMMISGFIPSFVILFQGERDLSDPPEEHYYTSYSDSSYYKGTFSDDGKTLSVEKVNSTSSSTRDNWKKQSNGEGCFGLLFKILALYLMTGLFVAWGVPYIIIAFFVSLASKNKLPSGLYEAYEEAKKESKVIPISFEHKVKFLKTKEKLQGVIEKKKKAENAFLAQYSDEKPSTITVKPYFYVILNRIHCMIIDYRYDRYRGNCGVTFAIIKSSEGNIEKKMVINGSYVISDQDTWKQDWLSAGARQETIDNIEYYENQLNKFTR